MKTWTGKIIKTVKYEIEVTVEADSWSEARLAGISAAEKQTLESKRVDYEARDMVQIGEPWAYSRGWYDMHGPDDLIVVERAHGNRYTEEDIAILRNRLENLELSIYDSWNGVGSDTVSFKCKGRIENADFTKKQLDILLAPR